MYKKNVKKFNNTAPCDFNKSGEDFELLGDKILKSLIYGADIGSTVAVEYDEDNAEGVDILCEPNADFFDIAEQFGEMVEQSNVPIENNNEE